MNFKYTIAAMTIITINPIINNVLSPEVSFTSDTLAEALVLFIVLLVLFELLVFVGLDEWDASFPEDS